jgi:hypothetical protein
VVLIRTMITSAGSTGWKRNKVWNVWRQVTSALDYSESLHKQLENGLGGVAQVVD